MIVIITGGLGSGKTCLLTRYAKISHNLGRNILSNYHLNNLHYKRFDIVDLYINEPNLRDIIICADEIVTFMDCRLSTTKRNRLQSYFIAQTRKKNCDLYATTQYAQFTDLRLSVFIDIWIELENKWIIDAEGKRKKHPYTFYATFHDYRIPKDIKTYTKVFDGRNYFSEYNTNEQIYPPDEILLTQKLIDKYERDKRKKEKLKTEC